MVKRIEDCRAASQVSKLMACPLQDISVDEWAALVAKSEAAEKQAAVAAVTQSSRPRPPHKIFRWRWPKPIAKWLGREATLACECQASSQS